MYKYTHTHTHTYIYIYICRYLEGVWVLYNSCIYIYIYLDEVYTLSSESEELESDLQNFAFLDTDILAK
jgi:hypothetical protein